MAKLSNHDQIEMVRRDSIYPNPTRAKKPNREQRRKLQSSLRRFGIKGGILVDRDTRVIVAGNALFEAAGEIGMDEVPVVFASIATEADRRAFVLAHNKLAEESSWDRQVVERELRYLLDQSYDFELTGFDSNDLDFGFASVADPVEDVVEPPAADARAVTRRGDLWLIGPHRVYCGDALDTASYEALLQGELADMVFSDPPYGVRVNGHVSKTGKHREFAMMSGRQTTAELTTFFRRVFRRCVTFSRVASIHYQCIDWRHSANMTDAADGVYTEFKQMIVWDKGQGSLGSFYRSQYELILVFKSGRGRHVNNFLLGQNGRTRTNIWRYDGMAGFGKGRGELASHPTPKSVAMVVDAIRDCSNPGDLILDPFAGSGTTAVAAHHAGRRCATIEIDPLYVDASIRRIAKASGLTIVHADGRNFDKVAADRLCEEMDNG